MKLDSTQENADLPRDVVAPRGEFKHRALALV